MSNDIKIENIVCTADRDQGDITTLAASIKRLGLLQPIILVKTGTDKYEVIDGRRRFAAIKSIGWRILPESSYTFGPETEDPKVMAHVANVERKQLTPAEEVKHLIELAKTHTGEQLAEIFGRTPGWIARRLKIADLIPDWLKVLDMPELAPLWTLDKLALIARQSEEVQKKLRFMICGYDPRSYSLDYITRQINDYNRQISTAIFDTADCGKCPNNTATNELLFDDSDCKDGICMGVDCWLKKTLAKVKTIMKNEKLIPVRGDCSQWGKKDTEYAEKIKAKRKYDFSKIRDPKQGEAANAIIVSGEGIGRRVVAVIRKETDGAAKPAEKKPLTIKEQETILKQKRNKKALELVREMIRREDYITKMISWLDKPDELMAHFLICLSAWGYTGDYTGDFGFYKLDKNIAYKKVDFPEFLKNEFYPQLVDKISEQIRKELTGTLDEISRDAGPAICNIFRIDWGVTYNEACRLIPEPKSLTEARKAQKGRKTNKTDRTDGSDK